MENKMTKRERRIHKPSEGCPEEWGGTRKGDDYTLCGLKVSETVKTTDDGIEAVTCSRCTRIWMGC